MKQIIKEIKEIENLKLNKDDWTSFDGFKVTTNTQEISLLMDMSTSCCENNGYFWSNDEIEDFIGSELKSIEIVDTELNKKKYTEAIGEYGVDGGGVIFVNLNTSKGVLQFTAYNSHNGYYGHTAKIISQELNHEEVL